MPNYAFRIRGGTTGTPTEQLKDWTETNLMDSNSIEPIQDVLRKSSAKIATSVPSPFARMYLFDTAFNMVIREQGNEIASPYHTLVSDCLDMMELLFNKGNDPGEFTYLLWNVRKKIGDPNTNHTGELNSKPVGHPHHLIAKAITFEINGGNPAFNNVSDIVLIYHKGILMGGTSPMTLFFTSPNWHRSKNLNLKSPKNQDYFSGKYVPLHERDESFQAFLHKFYVVNKAFFSNNCKGLGDYIKGSAKRNNIDLDGANLYNNYTDLASEYDSIRLSALSQADLIIKNGVRFFQAKVENEQLNIEKNSDFVIEPRVDFYKTQYLDNGSTKTIPKPLVLPEGFTDETYKYTKGNWKSNTMVQWIPRYPLYDRKLPDVGTQYPFLATSDFLEEQLTLLPFNVNKKKFFTGFDGDFPFLLPVKKEYFTFFTLEDLERYFSVRVDADNVYVQLRIPVRRGEVLFIRKYEKSRAAKPNIGLGIFPFYRVMDADLQNLNDYTVLLADRNRAADRDPKLTELNFYKYEDLLRGKIRITDDKPGIRSSQESGNPVTSLFYRVQSGFDCMEMKVESDDRKTYTGLIIPRFPRISAASGINHFTFAIDFGTSNTHIAYTENDSDGNNVDLVKSLTIGEKNSEDDLQMVLLNEPDARENSVFKKYDNYGQAPYLRQVIRREFIPSVIGKEFESDFAFPVKTATCERDDFKPVSENDFKLFSQINLGFNIDSEEEQSNKQSRIVYKTNLKWLFENSKDDFGNKARVRAFFESMLLLIRNKVILNRGKLPETKIIYMLPISMERAMRSQFREIWETSFKTVFDKTYAKLLPPVTESVAPYFYLAANQTVNIETHGTLVNIDIGGGTTDVLFITKDANDQTNYLSTSFRFAGNDLWSNGIKRGSILHNPFYKNLDRIRKKNNAAAIPDKRQKYLDNALNDANLNAEDVIGLLFRYDDYFGFSDSIKRGNPELLMVFFLHYSATIYHLIQILEQENMQIPRYITFTGKGSQYINLILKEENDRNDFTKILLSAYTSKPIHPDFRVIMTHNPKETTASGAALQENSVNAIDKGTGSSKVIPKFQWGAELNFENKIDDITQYASVQTMTDFHTSVLKNVERFLKITLENREIIRFLYGYEIKEVMTYKDFLLGPDVTKSGVLWDSYQAVLEDLKTRPKMFVSETFFFYPFKNALNWLARFIVEKTV